MQIDGNVQGLSRFVHAPEPPVVQRNAVAHPVQHRALEAELEDRPLQFRGRLLRRGQRQGGEAREPVRPLPDGRMGQVVDGPRHRRRSLRRQVLGTGGKVRQDLQVDLRLVHLAKPPLAKIQQRIADRGRDSAQQFRVRKMLLQDDDPVPRHPHASKA